MPLPQSSKQETFWALAGFESTNKSEMLSDAPHWFAITRYLWDNFVLYDSIIVLLRRLKQSLFATIRLDSKNPGIPSSEQYDKFRLNYIK